MLVLILAAFLGLAPFAQSSGFLIYEHGAAAMGMAGAFVSIANNATAVFHNPAGMAWLQGTQVSLGGTFIIPKGSLSLPNWPDPTYKNVDQLDQTFLAPNFYLTHKFGDKVAAGIGVFAPYGLGTKWPTKYPLRYLGTSTEMQTILVNPAISYKVNENLAFGGGDLLRSLLAFPQPRPIGHRFRSLWLDGGCSRVPGWGNGRCRCLQRGRPLQSRKILLRSHLSEQLRYQVQRRYRSGYVRRAGSLQALLADHRGASRSTFKFPDIFTAGVSYNLTEALLLALDPSTTPGVATINTSSTSPIRRAFRRPNRRRSWRIGRTRSSPASASSIS